MVPWSHYGDDCRKRKRTKEFIDLSVWQLFVDKSHLPGQTGSGTGYWLSFSFTLLIPESRRMRLEKCGVDKSGNFICPDKLGPRMKPRGWPSF